MVSLPESVHDSTVSNFLHRKTAHLGCPCPQVAQKLGLPFVDADALLQKKIGDIGIFVKPNP